MKEVIIVSFICCCLLSCQKKQEPFVFPSDDRELFFDYAAFTHLNANLVQTYTKQTETALKGVEPGLLFDKAQEDTIKKLIRLIRKRLPETYVDTVMMSYGFPVWNKGCLCYSGSPGYYLFFVPLIKKDGRRMNGFLCLQFEDYKLLPVRVCDRDLLEQLEPSGTVEEAELNVLPYVLTDALNFKSFENTVFKWEKYYSKHDLPRFKSDLSRDGFDFNKPLFAVIHLANSCYTIHYFQDKLKPLHCLFCMSYEDWAQIVDVDGSSAHYMVLPLAEYEML